MNGRKLILAAAGGAVAGSMLMAGLTVWLLLAEPVTVANAVSDHDLMPLVRAVMGALYTVFSTMVRFL